MKAPKPKEMRTIQLAGRTLQYQLVISPSARNLRVRVGLRGIEVVQPRTSEGADTAAFLRNNEKWLVAQLKRIERFRTVRKPPRKQERSILYRGEVTRIVMQESPSGRKVNQVRFANGCIEVIRGDKASTVPKKSLENWLRKQARIEIEKHLAIITARLRRSPRKIYVMGQRTKWGNCSALQNLSFNWRLIMAPDFVLRYLVTHEAVHLAVPDHSKKFWLTVQSLCPETERAKQWLAAQGHHLLFDSPLPNLEGDS